MGIHRLFFFILLVSSFSAHAYEVDNVTERYEKLKDSRDFLNDEVNFKLETALKELNYGRRCDKKELFEAMDKTMAGFVIGSVEWSAQHSPRVQKHLGIKDHIYSKRGTVAKVEGYMLTVAGMHASINLHGQYVGVDKLGHFFDQGAKYYEIYSKSSNPATGIKNAMEHGREKENGIYGLGTSGIRSYADLAANYSGFQFWMSLADGAKPYFKCENNKWVKVREFDFADYVSPSWDEGINCNSYVSKGFEDGVEKQEKNLETQPANKSKNRRFTCPVSPNTCVELQKSFGKNAAQFLGPKCLNAKLEKTEAKVSAQISARELGASNYDELAVTLTPAKKPSKSQKGKR